MQDIVLYCKSYREDILRARRLADSIAKHNCDRLPFYVSVPRKDLVLFKQQLPTEGVSLLEDESILDSSFRGRSYEDFLPPKQMQQVVKSEFWRLDLAENYLAIDSDSYFIRDFTRHDFLADTKTPYSLMHKQKDLFQFAARSNRLSIIKNFQRERAGIQSKFMRPGRYYDCGPSPFIWSSKVWETLYDEYC